MSKALSSRANIIAEKTGGAYSHARYGQTSWLANIAFLLTKFTPEQVEWIMTSKHARWAADSSEKPSGKVPLNTMEKWYSAGNLDAEKNTEMPGVDVSALAASRVQKLARIVGLEEEVKRLKKEIGA